MCVCVCVWCVCVCVCVCGVCVYVCVCMCMCVCVCVGVLFKTFSGINTDLVRTSRPHGVQGLFCFYIHPHDPELCCLYSYFIVSYFHICIFPLLIFYKLARFYLREEVFVISWSWHNEFVCVYLCVLINMTNTNTVTLSMISLFS